EQPGAQGGHPLEVVLESLDGGRVTRDGPARATGHIPTCPRIRYRGVDQPGVGKLLRRSASAKVLRPDVVQQRLEDGARIAAKAPRRASHVLFIAQPELTEPPRCDIEAT